MFFSLQTGYTSLLLHFGQSKICVNFALISAKAHTMEKQPSFEDLLFLLKEMISTPSLSGEEEKVADRIAGFLTLYGVEANRSGNNVWACNTCFSPERPTLLLNSHIDTVKPNNGYTRDPYVPTEIDGRIYGLGSNDAGASVVCLIAVFLHFFHRKALRYNLCLAVSAEEERSGINGIESIWGKLPPIDFAIVGEPTGMNMAIAEKGLLVIDCTATGQAGHAARNEGVNAIYKALDDIQWFRSFRFPKVSPLLGETSMSVTIIHGGEQHNVIPDKCSYTVDIRVNECYTHEEVLDIIREHITGEALPRSVRLRSSSIDPAHPLVQAGAEMGLRTFGSPTMSDQALMPVPSLKIGPGESSRSHSADEFIEVREIAKGIEIYTGLLEKIL